MDDSDATPNRLSRGEFLGRAAQAAGGLAVASAAAPSLLTAHAAPSSAAPVVLRLQNWFSQTDLKAWQIGLDTLQKAYPNIQIKLEYSQLAITLLCFLNSLSQ